MRDRERIADNDEVRGSRPTGDQPKAENPFNYKRVCSSVGQSASLITMRSVVPTRRVVSLWLKILRIIGRIAQLVILYHKGAGQGAHR